MNKKNASVFKLLFFKVSELGLTCPPAIVLVISNKRV